jgi:hypothetical protein
MGVQDCLGDVVGGLTVGIMLIPQGLAVRRAGYIYVSVFMLSCLYRLLAYIKYTQKVNWVGHHHDYRVYETHSSSHRGSRYVSSKCSTLHYIENQG